MRYAAVFEINFHLGELYFLLPLLYSIKYENGERICIAFTNKAVFLQMRQDSLMMKAIGRIPADIINIDYYSSRKPSVCILPLRVLRFLIFKFRELNNSEVVRNIVSESRCVFVQISRGALIKESLKQNKPLVRFLHSFSPEIYNINLTMNSGPKYRAGESKTIIINDSRNRDYYKFVGFENIVPIGYPNINEEWINLIIEQATFNTPFLLVYSYQARPDVLPEEKWEYLHQTTYEVAREVFGDIQIVVKPHPNQDNAHLRKFIERKKWENFVITNQNPMVVAYGATAAVSYITSGLFNSLLFGIPSVNYFNAHDEYIAYHKFMPHDYKAQNIPDVITKEELKAFLASVRDGTFVDRYDRNYLRIPTIQSLSELLEKVSSHDGF